MTLDETQTLAALDHLEKTTTTIEALLPVMRSSPQLEPALVDGVEVLNRNARAWLNQQRVRESMEKLRVGSNPQKTGAEREEPRRQPEPAVAPEPQVNPLEALGDLLKSLSPLADLLGRFGTPPRR